MTALSDWVKGARLRTLAAAIAPVFVGTGLARENFHLVAALLCLVVAVSLQIAVNFANDYSDGIKGVDYNRLGPIRLVGSGAASPRAVKNAAYLFFLIGSTAGIALATLTTLWFIPIGAIAIIAAWTYTGGPKPYGYAAFGEVSVFIFFGVVATVGSFYAQTRQLTALSFLLACALGFLSCAILVMNNLRDRERDAALNKKTLAVVLGDSRTRKLYLLLLAFAQIIGLYAMRITPWAAMTLATLPLAISNSRRVLAGASGKDLIGLLLKTGKLQIIFSLTLTLALII